MPSPDTLRYVQKQVNAGLTQLKAVTLLRGMQHLDKKLLRSMQEAVRRMQAAAKDNRLQSDLEKAMQGVERRLRSVDPDSWRLQLIRLLRCVLARVAKSEIAADMVRSSGHQLNEAARGVLQVSGNGNMRTCCSRQLKGFHFVILKSAPTHGHSNIGETS